MTRYEIKKRRLPCASEEPLAGPADATTWARRLLADEAQEVVIALFLDSRTRVIGYTEVARGGQNQCSVDMRVLFRAAILAGAGRMILAHNHPSGFARPSADDDRLTATVARCAQMLGIELADHVIVAEDGAYSYAEANNPSLGAW